jgi:hypothetical protein
MYVEDGFLISFFNELLCWGVGGGGSVRTGAVREIVGTLL